MPTSFSTLLSHSAYSEPLAAVYFFPAKRGRGPSPALQCIGDGVFEKFLERDDKGHSCWCTTILFERRMVRPFPHPQRSAEGMLSVF